MRSALFVLLTAGLFVGCATVKSAAPATDQNSGILSTGSNPAASESPAPKAPNITINYPNEFWAVLPPEQTPRGCAQYAINRITGAELDIRVLPGVPTDFVKAGTALMKKNGAQVSEITVAPDGSASVTFTIVNDKETIRGKLVGQPNKALPGAVMAFFGLWPAVFDASMITEFDYITHKVVIE